jgi:signal transduction histidine kinase/AmiR/NasT family two-component response regulator
MLKSKPGERVIVIAPIAGDAPAIAALLQRTGIQAEVCASLMAACEKLSDAGVLLLTEEALELPHLSSLLETLKVQPAWSQLPLIMLTSGGESRLAKVLDLAAEAAGGVTLLERPMSAATLLRSVQVALISRQRQYQVRDLLTQEQVWRNEAEAANRSKDEFLATVSHELRTPLNAILGWSTLLRNRSLDDATSVRAVESIERNAKAQAHLIEDILDVSRIITGKMSFEPGPVALEQTINAALDTVRTAADAKSIQIQQHSDPNVGLVWGDPRRLQQVVWNLLSNAVKFTPNGGRVDIRLERVDYEVEITVSDTGKGIKADFLPLIFERFRQADSASTRNQGGLGLGLAIVRQIIEMHGGTVRVESPGEGHGSIFSVRLPVMGIARKEQPRRAEIVLPSDAKAISFACPPELSGLRVLLVDDQPDTLEMLKEILERECCAEVITSTDAASAFEQFEQRKPDLLLSDIAMPNADGYALIAKVRAVEQQQQRRRTPAIAMTAYVRVEDRLRTLEAGYDRFLPKPIEPSELFAVLESLLSSLSILRSVHPDVHRTA